MTEQDILENEIYRRNPLRKQSSSKWIWFRFDGTSTSGKTKVFAVMTRGGPNGHDECLGAIKWHGPWRKYAFDPENSTVYEQDCLRDIAAFLDELMKEHKKHTFTCRHGCLIPCGCGRTNDHTASPFGRGRPDGECDPRDHKLGTWKTAAQPDQVTLIGDIQFTKRSSLNNAQRMKLAIAIAKEVKR